LRPIVGAGFDDLELHIRDSPCRINRDNAGRECFWPEPVFVLILSLEVRIHRLWKWIDLRKIFIGVTCHVLLLLWRGASTARKSRSTEIDFGEYSFEDRHPCARIGLA